MLVTMSVAACAAMKPTLAQERVQDAFRACREYTGSQITVKNVSSDGRSFMIEGGEASDQSAMKRCLSERYGYRFGG